MNQDLTEYDDIALWCEVQGVQEPAIVIRWGCTGRPNNLFCGAVWDALDWIEKMVSNGRGGQQKAWYCPACDCRQRPFARGKSMIADILNSVTGEWNTVLTNPPPAPITSALTLLKYENYQALIDEWGDVAREHLPRVTRCSSKQPSQFKANVMVRKEDFEALEEWSSTDWWVVAGLAVGWDKEKTKELQLHHKDKELAQMLAQAALEEKPKKIHRQLLEVAGSTRANEEGDDELVVSNDFVVPVYKCTKCDNSFPPDPDRWARYWLARFKHIHMGLSVPQDDKPVCKECTARRC